MFLQFSDDGVAFICDPAELGCFGIKVVFEALLDDAGDAEQPPAFGTALVMSRHDMRQVINCGGEVFATVGFGEAGNCCESGAVLIYRLY